MTESLLLKWGTIKGWDGFTEKSQDILKRYFDGEIQNDWSGEIMSKDEAKKYVKEYSR